MHAIHSIYGVNKIIGMASLSKSSEPLKGFSFSTRPNDKKFLILPYYWCSFYYIVYIEAPIHLSQY